MHKKPSHVSRRAALGLGASLALTAFTAASGCLPFHEGALPNEPRKTAFGPATFKTIRGTRVHYVDVGEGPVVVLIHGFASSLNTWKSIIEKLRKDHRVIALDLKGFGWTDRPPGDYSPKAQANLVFGLLDALGVVHGALVAHSWGSSVALQMALDAPDRVDRIALYDAWVYEEQIPTFFLWSRVDAIGEALFTMFYDERADEKISTAFYDKTLVTEELVDSVEEQLSRPGTSAAALAAVRGQHYQEVQKRYGTIDKPVLLLWGREDKVTTLEYGERLSKDLPRARLVVYPQCGHFPMIEAKAPSTRELVEFLANKDSGGAALSPSSSGSGASGTNNGGVSTETGNSTSTSTSNGSSAPHKNDSGPISPTNSTPNSTPASKATVPPSGIDPSDEPRPESKPR